MSNLQDGITAFKSGNKDEARRCFIIAMKEDPENENVWGWLYQVTKNDKEKIDCLNKIIAINPNNEKARQALERFLAAPAPAPTMKNIVSPVPNPPPYSANVERINPPITKVPKKNKFFSYALAIIASFCIMCAVAVFASQPNKPPTTQSNNLISSNPEQKINQILKDALGEGNREVERLSSTLWSDTDKTLIIRWTIDDNLTEDMIKRSAKSDIKTMLEKIVVDGIPYDYQSIIFQGTFPMQDVYGNASEDQVVLVSYQRSTLEKINWPNFLTDDMYKVADSVWLHPVFK